MLIADETMGMVAHPRPGREPEVVIIEQGLLLDTLVETFELLWRLSIEVAVPTRGSSSAAQEPTDLRSPLPGNRRLPMGRLFNASALERRAIGRLIWPRGSVIHRMDLILPPPAGPDVVTLHDVVAWKFEDESAPVSAAGAELRAADAVICVSEFTGGEAERLLGLTNSIVIPNGVGQDYLDAKPLDAAVQTDLGLPGPFVLYAGGSAARKNLSALAEAWSLVHGRLPDPVMPGLMASAATVIVPSLYGGFGLPALEALASGAPLVSSNRSSLPEVVGDAGTLVEPTGRAFAEALEHVAQGGADVAAAVERGKRRAREFTWDRSARAHAKVWSSVLS